MAKHISQQMLTCTVTLTPKQAIALRDLGVALELHCPNPNCGTPVIVVGKGKDKAGIEYKAHFEHKTRNPHCHYGVGIKALEKHLREDKIVSFDQFSQEPPFGEQWRQSGQKQWSSSLIRRFVSSST